MSASEHPDELLPWYANGSLKPQERAQVEHHLQACARCRAQVEFLAAVRRQIQSEPLQAPDELGLRRLLRTVRAQADRRRSWWRPALAAAVLVILAQTALLVSLWPGSESRITPLGAPPGEGVLIQVQFAPQATEAQIRALLGEIRGEIVAGPGALGVYRIRVEGVDASGSEEVESIVARLRRQDDLVLHVARE